MSGFTSTWLNLREAADQRARDPSLRAAALAWLGLSTTDATPSASTQAGEAIVVDLGAGTGSTLRALAVPGSQHLVWRLVEHDGDLLDEAIFRHGKHYRIEDYQADLNVVNELPLGAARLVTASALFDLVSAPLVDALIKRLTHQKSGWPVAVYATLTYDGTTTWTPAHPLDNAVLSAFNQDQRQDKGMGPALGPSAAAYLQQTLEKAGFSVQTALSPWQLNGSDAEMVEELIHGIAAAVSKGYGLSAEQVGEWQQFRLAHAASGTCVVGHVDLWAV